MYIRPDVSDRMRHAAFFAALQQLHSEATRKDEDAIKNLHSQVDEMQPGSKLLVHVSTDTPDIIFDFENDDVSHMATSITLVFEFIGCQPEPKPRTVIRLADHRRVLDSGAKKPWLYARNRLIAPAEVSKISYPELQALEGRDFTESGAMSRDLVSLKDTSVTFETNSYMVFTHSLRVILDTHKKSAFDQIMAKAALDVAEGLVKEGEFDHADFAMDLNKVGVVGLLIYSKDGKSYDFNFV